MIKPEEMDIFIALLEKDGEHNSLLEKIKLMREITSVSEESRKKIAELNQKLQEIK